MRTMTEKRQVFEISGKELAEKLGIGENIYLIDHRIPYLEEIKQGRYNENDIVIEIKTCYTENEIEDVF